MITSPYETTNNSRITGYQESSVMSQSNPFDNSMARSEVEMVMDQMTKQKLHDAGRLTECNSPHSNISRDCGSGKKVNISSMSDLVPEAEVDIVNKAVPEVDEENEYSPTKPDVEKVVNEPFMILED